MLQHRQGHHEGPLSGEFGISASLLAHGFNDNLTVIPIQTTPTILASVTVTPRVTGKFHVTCTVDATNANESNNTFNIGVGHGSLTVDYTKGSAITVFGSSVVNNSLTVEYGSGPLAGTIFPLNVPVTLDLFGIGLALGLSVAAAHSAQITAEELPN
jgi:hypothetical protein